MCYIDPIIFINHSDLLIIFLTNQLLIWSIQCQKIAKAQSDVFKMSCFVQLTNISMLFLYPFKVNISGPWTAGRTSQDISRCHCCHFLLTFYRVNDLLIEKIILRAI